jgi:hypothetical protein
MSLIQEIYTQLLELYARDLEVENIGLHLQVVALQTIRNPPVPVHPYHSPMLPYPNPYPVWCSTETTVRSE